MKFTEAFKSLGYIVESPRQDWSAISPHGVCLAIWQKEMAWDQGFPRLDTKLHAGPYNTWKSKPGNLKRKKHLAEAMRKFGGKIDIVIINGAPGESYGEAHPWRKSERRAHWQIESFDQNTGHFTARVREASGETSSESLE